MRTPALRSLTPWPPLPDGEGEHGGGSCLSPSSPGGWVGGWERRVGEVRAPAARITIRFQEPSRIGVFPPRPSERGGQGVRLRSADRRESGKASWNTPPLLPVLPSVPPLFRAGR